MLLNVECMTSDIDKYLLGHWTNKYQAQSNPHFFSEVQCIWEKDGDWYSSMNFTRQDGAGNPYRKRKHKLRVISDIEVVMENHALDLSHHPECDMIFKFDGNFWHGKISTDKCYAQGAKVISEIHLFGDKIHTMDQGINPRGDMTWGSKNLYRFTRV